MRTGDYDRGYLELLSQLTEVGKVTREQFLNRFYQMKATGDYFVTVIVDKRYNRIIGSATLVVERKFIRNCALVSSSGSKFHGTENLIEVPPFPARSIGGRRRQ